MARPVYPFTAIVGQDKAKLALLLNAVDPRLGGVLLTGPKGSGKSTLVRALGELLPTVERVAGCEFNCDPWDASNLCPSCQGRIARGGSLPAEEARARIVELPLSAKEDALLGTLDVEEALRKGVKALRPGLLAEANRNILYIDEVNLLPDYLVDCILDPAASGWNVVQREGLSLAHPARFTLVASMNPEEGPLRPQILDRFALSAGMEKVAEPEKRGEIVRRNIAFEEDPVAFRAAYEEEQALLGQRVERARGLLGRVKVGEGILCAISETCAKLGVDGFRPDLSVMRAARALAALEGREAVEPVDILRVSDLALGHRGRGGRGPAEGREIEGSLREILFKEVPPAGREEGPPTVPPPSEGELREAVHPPGPSAVPLRRRRRELPLALIRVMAALLTVALLLSLSVTALLMRAIILGLPPGGIGEVLALDQLLLVMVLFAAALAVINLLSPRRRRRPAVFLYESLGMGFRRRIVRVQRERGYPEDADVEEMRDKEALLSRVHKIINVPLYSSIDRLYKLVLNRGPRLLGLRKEEERRYRFTLERRRERRPRGVVGRHAKAEARSERGRYVSYEFPKRRPWDIALGPTLRAAAPHQAQRQPHRLPLAVRTEDVRVKVRESRTPLTMVLLLDMSESMAVSLKNIRNAVLSLHDLAYKKHDRVGLIVFKGSGAKTLQTPTANLNLIVERLGEVGASDLTPLAAGMLEGWRLLRNERLRNREIIPILAVISDGIANIPLGAPLSPFTRGRYVNAAQADAIDAAFLLQREGIRVLVINPSHFPVGDPHAARYKAEILERARRVWLEPTELLMTIPAIAGGYYYGIGEGGELERVALSEAFRAVGA